MIKYNKILCLTLCCSMLFSIPARGNVTIPPIPGDMVTAPSETQAPTSETGTSGETQTGPGVQNQTTAGPGTGGTGLPYTTAVSVKDVQNTAVEAPQIKAAGAALYDATNNRFLFEKDSNTRYYPASITKLMTALLVLENADLNDTVTFKASAVTNLEAGSVSLNVSTGDKISVKDCLYGLLLKSANEVANGLAEHVAGSMDQFADKMNAKAQALGATNTHFANPSGLNNSNHYTTARDMALIAKAAFENKTLSEITRTTTYQFPATIKSPQPKTISMGHKMIYPNDARYYEGIVGGKTGYTSLAGNTLVTCVEKNGIRLIAVVLKSKQTHYDDTKALLNYGFAMAAESVAENNTPSTGPGNAGSTAMANRWIQDANGWQFVKADGNKAQNECMMIDGEKYWFDQNTYIATGWRQLNNQWYYFKSSGAMAKGCWVETEGYWYCLDPEGNLYTNTTTPDGFPVDANGIWIQS